VLALSAGSRCAQICIPVIGSTQWAVRGEGFGGTGADDGEMPGAGPGEQRTRTGRRNAANWFVVPGCCKAFRGAGKVWISEDVETPGLLSFIGDAILKLPVAT
jgi:hypothetical protein